MQATITIQGKQYTGILKGSSYAMALLINGKPLMGWYRQGKTGTPKLLPVFIARKSDGTLHAPAYYTGHNGQVRNQLKYFLGVVEK
jgi:hypothetical protein